MTQPDTTIARLGALRRWIAENELDAFIVPSNDPHFSEYVAPHWQCRAWLSGFDGSAGTVVVTARAAALWTDSRYFLQAEAQLSGSGITLQRQGISETPSIAEWLSFALRAGSRVGVDGRLFSQTDYRQKEADLAQAGLRLVPAGDPFGNIWPGRPPLPDAPARLLDIAYSGESIREKLDRIRQQNGDPAAVRLTAVLDEIAWTLDIRGNDIAYNPLVISYLSIEPDKALFFVSMDKLTAQDRERLQQNGVELRPYESFGDYLASLSGKKVIVNPGRLDRYHYALLESEGAEIDAEVTPCGSLIYGMKAVKNATEIVGFRRAMEQDGVALVRFGMWLEGQIAAGETPSELEVIARLHDFRAQCPDFREESFDTIAGYGSHGAFVHYSATPQSTVPTGTDSFLLIDSGGQYPYGTTDITRTYHFGQPSAQQRADYTAILRGLADLSGARFPQGTRGAQLDVLARRHLWRQGTNYLHGTGHGIGHYLCVHEGPQSIRMEENPVTLEPGMIQSIEPGLYRSGEWGVRIENLVLVVPSQAYPGYLEFETLTLCPISLTAVDTERLDRSQREWIDTYHCMVYDRLAPILSEAERAWLAEKTRPLA